MMPRPNTWAGVVLICGCVSSQAATRLRYDSFLVFKANQGETVPLAVQSIPKAKFVYKDEARVIILDTKSRWVVDTQVPLGQKRIIQYGAADSGLHALCVLSGSNVVHAWADGRPWAVVARMEAPMNISGQCDAWYFAPPAGLESFSVFVHASVKGEAAIIKITDPEGTVVLTKEDDFDSVTNLKVKTPNKTTGQPWKLEVLNPGKPGFALDDVSVWLGPTLQPLLCQRPEWLAAFAGIMGRPAEKISHRVLVSADRLSVTMATPRAVHFKLDSLPTAKFVALRAHATDVDYRTEAPVSLNGVPLHLPVTGDGVTTDVTVELPPGALRVGSNHLKLTQDPVGGSRVYSVNRVELLFGEAINLE